MRRLSLVAVIVALGALLSAWAAPARADPATSVSLTASPRTVDFGRPMRFRGQVSPPSAGQIVDVLNAHGTKVAEATTAADGTYDATATPDRNQRVHAQWGTAASAPVAIRVRPRLSARRTDIRLFDTTTVTGRLVPASGGKYIDVTVWANGRPVERARPMLSRRGTFSARLEIDQAGRHSVVVRFQDWQYAPVLWRSKPEQTSFPPVLREGSHGPSVRLLERRFAELHYRVVGVNGSFDHRLADSVLAFQKVQGIARTSVADRATWRALAAPKVPVPRDRRPGRHFEVDLTRQVLLYVEKGRISAILHVSTGKPSTPTLPGTFHVWSKQAGFNAKQMYDSSFFDGSRAMHGYADVPPEAASHGCVRLPMWNALWVWDRAPIGIEVLVY